MNARPDAAPDFFAAGGEMGARMRALDWSRTPLGPVEQWPQSLRTTVSTCLSSRFPILVWWGPGLVMLYNDAYAVILGNKHPAALGRPGREVWPEIWPIIGPMLDAAMTRGEATWSENQMLSVQRRGFLEESYFTFSYSPIRDESGQVGGIFTAVTEVTEQILAERRLGVLRNLSERLLGAHSPGEACERATATLAAAATDVSFTLVYLAEAGTTQAALVAQSGLPQDHPLAAPRLELGEAGLWTRGGNGEPETSRLVEDFGAGLEPISCGAWPEPCRAAIAIPFEVAGGRQRGLLVAGLSPRLVPTDNYRAFFGLVARQLAGAIASAEAWEAERRRAEALAELDRAKTTFFSNVSHEFRTPLTLMLGPTEQALSSGTGSLEGEDLRTVHRNGLRMWKLVNALLDFVRIEAGHARANLEPTDLAALTADLASAFRSAVEHAGLQFEVECAPLPHPVKVDRNLWEKIVLNLLSNALKFTLKGSIRVSLVSCGEVAELRVEDTGIGIEPAELPRLFERFHRVEGARGRTQEGSGIGLALVHELVKLHGGSVEVSSEAGKGSVFVVRIPVAEDHGAPAGAAPAGGNAARRAAEPFLQEALRWGPAEQRPAPARDREPRILVVDDNADMRDYIARLLSDQWQVETASNGLDALARIQAAPPALVISDVMMPGMDGFGLLRAVRETPSIAQLPVILLSARAGEEATAQGLLSGATDYLVKPFAARELVARVSTQLERVRAQQLAQGAIEEQRRRLHSLLMSAPMGIAMLRGPELTFELANERYGEIVGKTSPVGRRLREVFSEPGAQEAVRQVERVYETGEPFLASEFQVELRRADGTLATGWFDAVVQATRDHEGRVQGVLIFAVDVTAQVQARTEVERSRARERELRRAAEDASRTKDEFLAMLGHELRNPLAPIFTAVHLLRQRGGAAVEKERAVIERQATHLARLVDDLLDVSRIAQGKVELKRIHVPLTAVLERALETAGPLLEERHQHLDVSIPADLRVHGDPVRLAQVFANLITNAAKYSERGRRVSVSAAADGARVSIRVRDEGIGISPEMLPRVFDLFVQEPQSLERSQGGLGLGLSIAKSLVESHGGSISAESPGRGLGSTFTLVLPKGEAGPAVAPAPVARSVEPEARVRRVLIVDDNQDAADLIADWLGSLGHEARVAYDGPSALRVAQEFLPGLVFLDLGLPVMDGYEVARRMRTADQPPRIVAITGYGQTTDRERSRAMGFEAHLVKPVDIDQLEALLREP